VDFLNQQVLISPLAWMVAAALAIFFLRDRGLRGSSALGSWRLPPWFPLALTSCEAGPGRKRDWDLWSMGSLPYVVAAVSWLASGLAKRPSLKFAAYVLVVVNLFHILPWIAVIVAPSESGQIHAYGGGQPTVAGQPDGVGRERTRPLLHRAGSQ